MTRFLLDTNVIVDMSKGRGAAGPVVARLNTDGHALATCAVVVAEFYSGALPGEHPAVDELFDTLEVWPMTIAAARIAGVHRYLEARRGRVVSAPDALIGAVAREQGATLLTGNVRDFTMNGLSVTTIADLSQELGLG